MTHNSLTKQNIPQLGIQLWFLIQYSSGINVIVYASIIFSSLSLIITALTIVSQRNILKSRNHVTLEFDVTGPMILENMRECRNKIKSIKRGIAASIGVDNNLLEITRPMTVKNGLRLHVNIYVNYTKAIDMNIERDFNEANHNGQITKLITTSWKLTSAPNISNIVYTHHVSEERKKNTVTLKMVKTEIEMNTMKLNDDGLYEKVAVIAELPVEIPYAEVEGNTTNKEGERTDSDESQLSQKDKESPYL